MNFIETYKCSPDLCEKIIETFESNKSIQVRGMLGYGNEQNANLKRKNSIDLTIDVDYIKEIKNWEAIWDYCHFATDCLKKYHNKYFLIKDMADGEYRATNMVIERYINIQKYVPPDGGFHQLHFERSNGIESRELVFMTYLNTVHEGGGTAFPFQKLKTKPVVGNTIIWPAGFTHRHVGIRAPKETKYIITGWFRLQELTEEEKKVNPDLEKEIKMT